MFKFIVSVHNWSFVLRVTAFLCDYKSVASRAVRYKVANMSENLISYVFAEVCKSAIIIEQWPGSFVRRKHEHYHCS